MITKIISGSFLFKNPIWVIIIIALSIIPHFAIDYEACYNDLKLQSTNTTLLSFIRHVLIEKFVIALFMTVFLFSAVFCLNKKVLQQQKETFSKQIKTYILFSIPLFLVAFLLYWLVQIPLLSVFSSHHVDKNIGLLDRIDLVSLLHFYFLGYLLVLFVIYKSFNTKRIEKLEVLSPIGKVLVEVNLIEWIKKEGTFCEIGCDENIYRTDLTVKKLAEILNSEHFIRVNRASIVNKSLIVEYNYWENHKYILKVGKAMKEFIVTRKRFKIIKEELLNINS